MTITQINRALGRNESRRNVWEYPGAAEVTKAKNVDEALKTAGMDWNVEQEPLLNPRTGKATPYVTNFRGDNDEMLGVVGKTYRPVQNREAFEFLDNLAPMGITFERIGMSTKGNRVWMCVKLNDMEILGDTVENYIVLANYHDGSGSLKAAMSPSRQWCHNCLPWIFNKAQRVYTIRHTSSAQAKMKEAETVFNIAGRYMAALEADAAELSKIKISEAKFDNLSEELFPITEEDTITRIDRQEQQRYLLKQTWNADDLGNHRGTGWGFMNAVADYEQHKVPVRARQNGQERALLAVVDGSRLLTTARELVATI